MQVTKVSTNFFKTTSLREPAKVQTKADKIVQNAMTDEFVEQLKSLAKENAQNGVYMDQGFVQLRRGQMDKYVSPDRSGPMAQTNQVLQEVAKEEEDPLLQLLDRLLGNKSSKVRRDSDKQTYVNMSGMAGGGTGTIHHNSTGQTAEIFSPDGEKIASYNSNGCGWTIEHTQAEDKFLDAAAKVYMEAYHAARGEIKAMKQNPVTDHGGSESFDVRA